MSDRARSPSAIQRLGLGSREPRAWALYDWANSAFVTTVVAAILPIYYSDVAASQLPDTVATAYWGYTTAIALAVIAVLSPILGAIADYMGAKKRFLAVFLGFGVTFTALLLVCWRRRMAPGFGYLHRGQNRFRRRQCFLRSTVALGGQRARHRSGLHGRGTPWGTWAEGCCWR